MKRHPSWISLIGSCVLMVLAAALAFAVIVAGGSVALAGHQKLEESQGTLPVTPKASGGAFEGMVTDSRCGARHFRRSHLSPAQCVRLCVRAGASYVLVDGEHQYTLVGGDDALERFVGERVKISGTRQGSTIEVSSASPLF